MCKLQVGKPAVCVSTHPKGAVKAGQIHEIAGIKKSKCGCIVVDVGIPNHTPRGELVKGEYNCIVHGEDSTVVQSDGIWWLHHTRFAPIEDMDVDALLDQILKEKETIK